MKISLPRPRQGKPKGGHHRRGKGNPGWLHGRWKGGQKPQSKIRTLADMSHDEIKAIMEKYKHGQS